MPTKTVKLTKNQERLAVMRRLHLVAKAGQELKDSCGRMIGVCNGATPAESDDDFNHRVASVVGRIKSLRKAGRVLATALRELDERHSS